MQTIYAFVFSAATSLNAFWILNIAKEASPAVKAFFNFHPVTGPLLGLYLASIAVLILSFIAVRGMRLSQKPTSKRLIEWYFVLSAILFFFAIFPPVYVPIVEWLIGQ